MSRVLAGLAAGLLLTTLPALAEDATLAKDRAAVTQCLQAARSGKRPSETCIGTVQGPCIKLPGGETTVGMSECAGREIAVWDERLNAAYRRALGSYAGQVDAARDGGRKKLKGADIIRDAQRSWLVYRDKKCDAASLPMEGGTGAGLLVGDCILTETARQAIWLETLKDDER